MFKRFLIVLPLCAALQTIHAEDKTDINLGKGQVKITDQGVNLGKGKVKMDKQGVEAAGKKIDKHGKVESTAPATPAPSAPMEVGGAKVSKEGIETKKVKIDKKEGLKAGGVEINSKGIKVDK